MKHDNNLFKKLYHCEKRISIPTCITLVRIILVPFIVSSMVYQQWHAAFIWFLLAALTDVIDGSLARLWNDTTVLGACLDPLADKILLISCFFTLAYVHAPLCSIPHWFLVLICLKETIIILGSLALLIIGPNFSIRPTYLGKCTTLAQIIFIIGIFISYFFNVYTPSFYYNVISLIAGLIILTCAQYIQIGLKYLIALMIKL